MTKLLPDKRDFKENYYRWILHNDKRVKLPRYSKVYMHQPTGLQDTKPKEKNPQL